MWPFRRTTSAGRTSPAGDLGQRGEALAAKFLKKKGMKILARNYRCPTGEVDLIALDAGTRKAIDVETIAFVEVKTRTSDRYTDPHSAVNAEKQRRLRRAAEYYLRARKAEDFNARFDIVSVVFQDGQAPKLEYIPEAF